jgi:hypothetical protein
MKNEAYFRKLDQLSGGDMDRRQYNKDRMVIWNPDGYSKADVRAAAIRIIGTMSARREDADQATLLL